MKALNFYSSVYHGFLVCRDKRCTIRLGDKRGKYQEGEVVLVSYGDRYKKRRKVFTAVLDRVTVKRISELTEDEWRGEDPNLRSQQDVLELLRRIYERPVDLDEVVSVIHFSEITD